MIIYIDNKTSHFFYGKSTLYNCRCPHYRVAARILCISCRGAHSHSPRHCNYYDIGEIDPGQKRTINQAFSTKRIKDVP